MIRKRGDSWQVDVVVGGKRVRRSAPTEKEAKALEARLQNQGTTDETSMSALVRTTWSRHWRNCKDGLGLVKRAELVLNDMGWSERLVSTITASDLLGMMDKYRDKGLTDATVNRKLASITKLLSTAIEQGYIKYKPPVKQVRERNGRVRFLTRGEEDRLLQLALEHEYYGLHGLIIVLIDTGCRVSEALGLLPCDASENGQAVTFHDTKNGDTRTVPLTARARAALFTWKQYKLTQAQVNHQWNRLRSQMGLAGDKQMVPHILRHTCASRLVQNGIDLRIVKEWMGHKSISMTMRYAHLRLDNLMQARDVLEGLQAPKERDAVTVTSESTL